MLGKLPFVLGYGVYCQNGGLEKIFFQFLTFWKKCLDAGKNNILDVIAIQPRKVALEKLRFSRVWKFKLSIGILARVSQMPDFLKSSQARSLSQPFWPKSYKNAKTIKKSYV